MTDPEKINERAFEIQRKLEHKLHLNTLELVLGALVRTKGVKFVRGLLLFYARNMKYF